MSSSLEMWSPSLSSKPQASIFRAYLLDFRLLVGSQNTFLKLIVNTFNILFLFLRNGMLPDKTLSTPIRSATSAQIESSDSDCGLD